MDIVFDKNEEEILCVYHEELTKAFGTDAPKYRLNKVMRALEDAVSGIFIRRGNSTDDEVENLLSLINKIIDVRLKCYDEDFKHTLKLIIMQNIC